MSILSINYILFLSITFIAYYLVNNKFKYLVIFFASILFILSISVNVLLFSLSFTGLNYVGGLILYKFLKNQNLRKVIFWTITGLDIGILAFYKYINFIFDSINSFFKIFQATLQIDLIKVILPVGISYYTFQSIGYLIRINRGFEIPEKNIIKFSSFLLFFPKFISGPVERSNHFLPQISNRRNFNKESVTSGLRLILFGAFKKITIANTLYLPVSVIYSSIHEYSGIPLMLVLIIQLIYVYFDFSGYTDIALGSAKILGIDIIDNFNRPFLSKSITEFWKRWHISLSSWCNDFIFLPFIIKYRKLGTTASFLGIFLTFLIIGIWHGANWTFVILGLLQGIAITYEFFTKRYRIKLASIFPIWFSNALSRMFVFFYMGFSMIFFFSKSVSDAWYYITHILTNIEFKFSGYDLNIDKQKFLIAILSIVIIYIIEMLNEKGYNLQSLFLKQSRWIRWTTYYIIIILIFITNSEISSFIYKGF